MKSIVLISDSYYPRLGGLEKVTAKLSSELNKRNYKVYVVTKYRRDGYGVYFNNGGIKVIRVPWIDSVAKLLGIWLAGLLIVLCNFVKPVAIHYHFPKSFVNPLLIAKKVLREPLILSFHGHDILGLESDTNRDALVRLCRTAHAVSACSTWLADIIQNKLGITGVITLHNFIDFSDKIFSTSSLSPEKNIFCFGRLEEHKGFQNLINAFSFVLDQYNCLYIAGEGFFHRELLKIVQDLKLSNRVIFLGRLQPHDIQFYLANSHVAVIPSLREPFGLVVLEALSQGNHILSSNVGGIPEILPDSMATLVPPTITNLSTELYNLSCKSIELIDFKSRGDYLKNFSVNSFISSTINIYGGERL